MQKATAGHVTAAAALVSAPQVIPELSTLLCCPAPLSQFLMDTLQGVKPLPSAGSTPPRLPPTASPPPQLAPTAASPPPPQGNTNPPSFTSAGSQPSSASSLRGARTWHLPVLVVYLLAAVAAAAVLSRSA